MSVRVAGREAQPVWRRLLARVERAARAFEIALDRHKILLFVGIGALLLSVALLVASQRVFWNDELFTYYIARVPTLSTLWDELARGYEQTPPLSYLLTRGSLEVFGTNRVALRFPEALAFALGSACLFQFVARRTSALYGLVAVAFAVATTTFRYAYEARAYGLVLAFGMAALLCWQSAGERARRIIPLAGMSLSLAAAAASHYYAILLVAPLAAGEAVRALQRRRVDYPMLAAIGAGFAPLLAFLPLIEGGRRYSARFWAKPAWSDMVLFYDWLLTPGVAAVAAVVFAAGLVTLGVQRTASRVPLHEVVAVSVLAALPVFGVLLAELATGAYTDRYVLPAAFGIAVLLGFAAHRLDRRAPLVGVVVLLLLSFASAVQVARTFDYVKTEAAGDSRTLRFLSAHAGGAPIVVADGHAFFELSYDIAEAGGPRLVYLSDREAALSYFDTDTVERGLVELQRIAPLTLESYRSRIASRRSFLLYSRPGYWDWLTPTLRSSGARLSVRAHDGSDVLYDVQPPLHQ